MRVDQPISLEGCKFPDGGDAQGDICMIILPCYYGHV